MPDDKLILSTGISYSPSALLQLFNTALTPSPTKNMIQLKGIYQPGRGANYNGFFYDQLKDETTDAMLTLLVPALLKASLEPGKTIEFHGYITKRVVPGGGRIEIHANIMELLGQTQNKYSEKEIRSLAIQQEKAARGYRDVDSFIKSRIVQQQRVSVTILIGKAAIIDQDIIHAMEEGIGFYDLRFERIGLTSEREILDAFERYNDTAEMENSKAKLVETITVSLKANYEKQVQNLKDRIKSIDELGGKTRALAEQEALGLKEQLKGLIAERGAKDVLLERTKELAERYERQVRRLEDGAGRSVWWWAVAIGVALAAGVVGWLLGRG